MENFKFIIFSIVVLILVALLGYWAFFSIESGGVHADRQKQKELEQKNEQLTKEVEELKNELASLQALQAEQIENTETPTEKSPETTIVSSKHQDLINALQKLVDEKVFMKEKSKGTRVGTVQTFLNLYNKTSSRVDNDYGKSTKDAVMKFQKAVGLTADGEAGPSTFQKMIDWLKKQ